MTDDGSTQIDETEEAIAREIARVQAEYYGRGPEEATAYFIPGKVVLVVLTETFTPAETVMVKHDAGREIQNIRRTFQQINADQFKSIVEQATGDTVSVFLSETNIEERVSVEVFLLGPPRTDMDEFEEADAAEPEA